MAKVLTDFHIHSDISVDASGSMGQVADAAYRAGLKHIAFSDHLDLNPADAGYGRYDLEKVYDSWKALVARQTDTKAPEERAKTNAGTQPVVRTIHPSVGPHGARRESHRLARSSGAMAPNRIPTRACASLGPG